MWSGCKNTSGDSFCLSEAASNPVSWQDIINQSKCYPEQKEEALWWIKRGLGYLPYEDVYLANLPFLQSLIKNNHMGIIEEAEFHQRLFFHLKTIRNREMLEGGWVARPVHGQREMDFYKSFLSIYAQATRQRLSTFLGYEPSIDHSLGAEVYLRQIFEDDRFYQGCPYTEADFKAVSIVKYREAFFTKGETTANNLSLTGFVFWEHNPHRLATF